MNILITGATGFIGSYLLPRLQQENHQLIATTRYSANHNLPDYVKVISLGEIDGNTNWNQALKNIDTVIHLAGRAHILQETTENPETEFIRVNVEGTRNLVQQAIASSVKHFIFISSIGAVTTLSKEIVTENTIPNPDTFYGKSKLAAEQALINLTQNTAMNWTILRPTLVYGKGNPGNMASLISLIKKQFPLPFGCINNQRSFLYVENLVDAIALCVNNSQSYNQLFHISDNQDISTPELIIFLAHALNMNNHLLPIPLQLLKVLGVSSDLVTKITKKTLPTNTSSIDRLAGSLVVDNSKICQTLSWQPPYTTEKGIFLTVNS